ncbi:MAG: cytochrome c biogenesis protein CcdA, partial [Mariprofundaceae bacterium]
MIEITFFGAFLAGLLSFLSPCVLPLVPAYLSYISGTTIDQLLDESENNKHARRHALKQSLWFVC